VAPFIIGVVAALVVGWWLFPKALYSEKTQPLRFSHTTHVEMAGMYCEDCHYLREDGTFNGLPTTEQCASCHMDVMGSDPAEARFVEDYVRTGKEVDWEVYQYQPDNVFFSHAAHNFEQCTMCHADLYEETGDLCNECHPDVASTDTPPAVEKNVITGYSKGTMKMWACERCHALEPHRDMTYANNACFTCHK
jgi:hypothetical protein